MTLSLRDKFKRLYYGDSPTAQTFRTASLIFEILIIAFFVIASFLPHEGWVIAIELTIAAILLVDFLLRWWMSAPPSSYFRRVSTWTDLIVLITLILPALRKSVISARCQSGSGVSLLPPATRAIR